ncbi:hypothetical protein [Nocardia alni]|uniref:hypothetical protein n=1 Tax=Nocardia alni TaxID=2815723 RepID=UPI001C219418|nr:hypothetical protein [Nocardia alni]
MPDRSHRIAFSVSAEGEPAEAVCERLRTSLAIDRNAAGPQVFRTSRPSEAHGDLTGKQAFAAES